MTTVIERYRQASERRQQIEAEVKAQVQEAFGEVAKEIFEKHPRVLGFAWTQYTPYFNDGDACVFRARIDEFTIKTSEKIDGNEAEEEGDGGFVYSYVHYWMPRNESEAAEKHAKLMKDDPVLYPAWTDISTFLLEFQSDLEGLFGDHVEVWVTPDGVSPEGYDHD